MTLHPFPEAGDGRTSTAWPYPCVSTLPCFYLLATFFVPKKTAYAARSWGTAREQKPAALRAGIVCCSLVRAARRPALAGVSSHPPVPQPCHSPLAAVPDSSCLSYDSQDGGTVGPWGSCRGPRRGHRSLRALPKGQSCCRNVARGRGACETGRQREGCPGTTSRGQA